MIAPALQSDWILPCAAKEKLIARRENGVVARRASLIDAFVHRTLLSRECLTAAGSDPLDERPDGFHHEIWLFHMNIVTALGYDVRSFGSACEELTVQITPELPTDLGLDYECGLRVGLEGSENDARHVRKWMGLGEGSSKHVRPKVYPLLRAPLLRSGDFQRVYLLLSVREGAR